MINEINDIFSLKSELKPNFTKIHKHLISLNEKLTNKLLSNDQQFNDIKLRLTISALYNLLNHTITDTTIRKIEKLERSALTLIEKTTSEGEHLDYIYTLTNELYNCTNNRILNFRIPNHLRGIDRDFWVFLEKVKKIDRMKNMLLNSPNIENIRNYKSDARYNMREYTIKAIELIKALLEISSGNKENLKSILFKNHKNAAKQIFNDFNRDVNILTNGNTLLVYGCLSNLEPLLKEYVHRETTG